MLLLTSRYSTDPLVQLCRSTSLLLFTPVPQVVHGGNLSTTGYPRLCVAACNDCADSANSERRVELRADAL